MASRTERDPIRWKIHLTSSPARVYDMLDTPAGRERFWALSAEERSGTIHFVFPNGERWSGEVIERVPSERFSLLYFGGSTATFVLAGDASGGTDLALTDDGVPAEHRCEVQAGWVSVLLALKAAVDFGVDLRNHDPERTWSGGYADN